MNIFTTIYISIIYFAMPRRKNVKITTKIIQTLWEYHEDNGTFPSVSELARLTGCTRNTVREHLRAGGFTDSLMPLFRYSTLGVLAGLSKKASSGDAPAAKLWLQYVEGWKETSKVESKTEIAPDVWAKMEQVFGIK